MRFIKRTNLEDAAFDHPDVLQVLATFVGIVRAATWETPSELVTTSPFPARAIANGRVIFNIKGNHYRLICAVRYANRATGFPGVVLFKFFGTHAEYDKIDPTTVEP